MIDASRFEKSVVLFFCIWAASLPNLTAQDGDGCFGEFIEDVRATLYG
jgi:hypothetical protein